MNPNAGSKRSGGSNPFADAPAAGGGDSHAGEDSGSAEDGTGAAGGSGRGEEQEPTEAGAGPGGESGGSEAPSTAEVGGVEAARDAVRRLVEGISNADPTVCTTLMTQLYVEAITGKEGTAAVRRCERDVSKGGPNITIDAFGPAEIKGNRALIRVRLLVDGVEEIRGYDMRRGSDGAWRVDGQIG